MGVIDGGGNLLQDVDGSQGRQSAIAQTRGKTAARREAHAHPGDPVVDSARKNGNDSRVIEESDYPRFLFESRGERGIVKKFWRQHFERDRTIEPRVVRFVNRSHPSLAQQPDDSERADRRSRRKGDDG
jgi:hypothetical protein